MSSVSTGPVSTPSGREEVYKYFEEVVEEFANPFSTSCLTGNWNIVKLIRRGDIAEVTLTPKEKRYKTLFKVPPYARINVRFEAEDPLNAEIEAVRTSGGVERLSLALPVGEYYTMASGNRIPQAFLTVERYLSEPERIGGINEAVRLVVEDRIEELPVHPAGLLTVFERAGIRVNQESKVKVVSLARRKYGIGDYTRMIIKQAEKLSGTSGLDSILPRLPILVRKGIEVVVNSSVEDFASMLAEIDPELRKRRDQALETARLIKRSIKTGENYAKTLVGEETGFHESPENTLLTLVAIGLSSPTIKARALREYGLKLVEELRKLLEEAISDEVIVETALFPITRAVRSRLFFENALPTIVNLDLLLNDEDFINELKKLNTNLQAKILEGITNLLVSENYTVRGHWRRTRRYTSIEGKKLTLFIKEYSNLKKAVRLASSLTTGDIVDSATRVSRILGVNPDIRVEGETVRLRINDTIIRFTLGEIAEKIIDRALVYESNVTRETIDEIIMDTITRMLEVNVESFNVGGRLGKVIIKLGEDGYTILHPFKKGYGWKLDELGEELVEKGGNYYHVRLLYEYLYLEGRAYWGNEIPPEIYHRLRRIGNTSVPGVVEVVKFWRTPETAIVKMIAGRYGLIIARDGLILEAEDWQKFLGELADAVATAPPFTLDLRRKKLLLKWLEEQGVKVNLDPIALFSIKTNIEVSKSTEHDYAEGVDIDGRILVIPKTSKDLGTVLSLTKKGNYTESGTEDFEVVFYERDISDEGILYWKEKKRLSITRVKPEELTSRRVSVVHKGMGLEYPSSLLARVLSGLRGEIKKLLLPGEPEGTIIAETSDYFLLIKPITP